MERHRTIPVRKGNGFVVRKVDGHLWRGRGRISAAARGAFTRSQRVVSDAASRDDERIAVSMPSRGRRCPGNGSGGGCHAIEYTPRPQARQPGGEPEEPLGQAGATVGRAPSGHSRGRGRECPPAGARRCAGLPPSLCRGRIACPGSVAGVTSARSPAACPGCAPARRAPLRPVWTAGCARVRGPWAPPLRGWPNRPR